VTPSAHPSAATPTIPRATRLANRSSPAGPSGGSPSWASTATPGPPRWLPAACSRWTTPTAPPQRRSGRCSGGCPTAGRCHGLCSTPATTPPSSPGPGRAAGGGAGAAALGPLLLRRPATATTGQDRPSAAPWRQVQLRRPGHLADPTATLACQDDQYGTVTVAAWAGLHPKQQRHLGHGSGGPRPIVRGTVICVQVERVPARTRPPKVLWLWWAGPAGLPLDLDLAWRAYIRRFDLEHTVRFWKQTLGWTTPRPRHPEQAERWTWLVLACDAQLRLARAVVADARLPWERPRPPGRLSPGGSAAGFRDFGPAGLPGRPRRNPQGALPAAPRAAAAGPPCATRRSRSPPRRPARRRPRPRKPPHWQRSSPPGRRPGQRPTRHAHRVKSQAERTFRNLG
jgi:hypothetical protein